jgi:hypothetical protein
VSTTKVTMLASPDPDEPDPGAEVVPPDRPDGGLVPGPRRARAAATAPLRWSGGAGRRTR